MVAKLLGRYLNALALVAPKTAGRHGFHILCYPFRNSIKPHHREFLDTAEKFTFSHGGNPVQVYRWGQGPKKVLFLHGWQSHSFRWKNYIQALPADGYTLYSIDAPGHGASGGKILNVHLYADVIQKFIELHGEMDTIVAHSMGSFSILYALHRQPSLSVGRMVLMAPPGEGTDFIEYFRTKLKLSKRTLKYTLEHFQKTTGKPMSYFSTPSFARSMDIPGLIVHDEEDRETPYRYALLINQGWKKSSLITTRGLKHNLKSPEVVQAVCTFIQGNSGELAPAGSGVGQVERQAR